MTELQKHLQKTLCTCIVIGPMPFHWSTVKKYLKASDTKLFFIDGGSIHLDKFKKHASHLIKKSITLGDGDSSKRQMTWKKIDQDLSDLAYFFEVLAAKKITSEQYIFVGFLGGRIDHQLFNLGEMSRFVDTLGKNNQTKVWMDQKIQFLTAGKHSVDIIGRFSIASFSKNQIKVSGNCLYKVEKWLELSTLSSRGLSNEGSGAIVIETKAPLALIFS